MAADPAPSNLPVFAFALRAEAEDSQKKKKKIIEILCPVPALHALEEEVLPALSALRA